MFSIERTQRLISREKTKKNTKFKMIFESKVEKIKEKVQDIVSKYKNNLTIINALSKELQTKKSDNEIDFTSFFQLSYDLQSQIKETKKELKNAINNIIYVGKAKDLKKQQSYIKKELKEICKEKFLVLKHEMNSQEKYIEYKINEMQSFKNSTFWTNQSYKNKNKPGLADIFISKPSSDTDDKDSSNPTQKHHFSKFSDDIITTINSQEKSKFDTMVSKCETQTFKFQEKVSDLKKQILPTISELDENKLPSTNSVQMEQVNIFNISTQIEILKEEVKILESNFPKTMKMIPEHVKQTIKSTNEKLEKQQKEMSKNNKNKKFNNSISSISDEISDKDIIEMHYGKNHICSIV